MKEQNLRTIIIKTRTPTTFLPPPTIWNPLGSAIWKVSLSPTGIFLVFRAMALGHMGAPKTIENYDGKSDPWKIVLIKRRFIAKNKRKPVFFSIFSLFLLFSGSFSLFSRFRWKLGASRQFLTPWKSRVEKTQHKMNYRKLNEILIFIKSFCELSFHTLGAVPLIFYLYMNLSGLTPPNSVMKNIKGTVHLEKDYIQKMLNSYHGYLTFQQTSLFLVK